MRGFHHKPNLYVPVMSASDENRGVRLSPHCFMLVNAERCFFFFRHGAAVGDQSWLQQILGTIGGAEGASRG